MCRGHHTAQMCFLTRLLQAVLMVFLFCSLTNEGIPPHLTELANLKAIGLKRNNLSAIPEVLGSMHSLQEIYLENNPTLEVRDSLPSESHATDLAIMQLHP